jgi:hypothetical protein
MAADTADKSFGISGERDYTIRESGQRKKIAFVDYMIDGIDTLDDECRDQIYIAIQYKVSSGRWVDAWNEMKAKAMEPMTTDQEMADGTMTIMPAVEEPKEELMEVEITNNYIQVWLNVDRDAFVNEIQLALNTIDVNITVPMRIAWMDASGKSIQPLEQTFVLNFITPYTAVAQTNDCASAAAVFKNKARNE